MPASPSQVADSFRAVGLAEVEALAALQHRVDTKYVISSDQLAALADRLRATHAVLEIDGRRAFGYRSTYFDTADLDVYRSHVQQRRRRYKYRSREYVDSGLCMFEVKLKGLRGRTIKHRIGYDRTCRDELSGPALAFLRTCLERSYGRAPDGELRPALAIAYTRLTFAAPGLGERVTCDFELAFAAPDGTSGRLAEDTVTVESKSGHGNTTADRALRAIGARPEDGCSKYCLGVGFTNPRVNRNEQRPLLRRHFRAAPLAVALALGAAAPAASAEIPRLDVHAAEAIRDDPKVPARLTVDGRTHRVGIELRGQSSQAFPKKPYALETRRKVRLLDLPRERDWTLNAAYTDPSLLRDVLAHDAARWRSLRAAGFVEALLRTAERHARTLRASAPRNYNRWRTLDRPVFRNQPVHSSHPAAVTALTDWLARRAAWMDTALAERPAPFAPSS